MTDNVTPAEKQQILDAIAKRRKQPRKLEGGTGQRLEISREEYQKRMLAEIAKDKRDAARLREERIKTYVTQWRKQVGERFRDADTEDPIILDKINRIKRGVGGHRTSVVLAGEIGIGKTWMAYAYLNKLIKEGLFNPAEIVHDTEASILGRIASGGFKRDEMFQELVHPMHKVFFIDDVGQAYYSDDVKRQSVWFELINHIYTNDLILVMTTNKKFQINEKGQFVNMNSLSHWLGEAAFDRVRNIVGSDGLIVPGNVNRRPDVFRARDLQAADRVKKS